MQKVDTAVNSADFLTKAVSLAKFEWCRDATGIRKYSPSGRMLGLDHTSDVTVDNHYAHDVNAGGGWRGQRPL